jgi:hypothetical protein
MGMWQCGGVGVIVPEKPKPVLQALVLADQVYQDAATGKKIIAGTFNTLFGRSFPCKFNRSTFAFISLTEVRGRAEIVLRFVRLDTNEVILSTRPISLTSPDPRNSTELIVEVPPFPMPAAGTYAFEIMSDDVQIGSVRMRVVEARDASDGGEGGGK